MVDTAKGPYEGRLKALPKDRRVLQQWYPGWSVLADRLTATSLRAKDVRRILGLTYRQINHWHTRKLLWFTRSSESKWRQFSIADIFGLALVRSVADLGISFDKLQKSFAIKMSVPDFLWRALPYFVAGRMVYLYTDFESFCNVLISGSKSANKAVEVPVDSASKDPTIILPIQPIVKSLANKLDLADFRVRAAEDGSYLFQINGVPLHLEDLRYREEAIGEIKRTQKALRRDLRKRK